MKRTNKEFIEWFGLKVGDRILCQSVEYEVIEDSDGIFLYNGRSYSNMYQFLDEEYTIIKTPKLSDAERSILESLPEEYKWIARNKDKGYCSIFTDFPKRDKEHWDFFDAMWNLPFFHLFKFIKWEDEPYEIKELLK